MKPGKAKPRSLVLTLVFSAGVLAYAFLLFLPTQRSIGKLRTELRKQREYIVQANQEYAAYEQLREEFRTVDEYVSRWRGAAPREANLPELLGTISQRAAECGVTLRRMNPGEAVQLASVGQHSFQFDVTGGFPELFEFLRALESLPGVVWSNRLQLESGTGRGGQLRCELVLTVFTDNREISD